MTLTNPDPNGIGRYSESTPLSPGAKISGLLNRGLQAVSDALGLTGQPWRDVGTTGSPSWSNGWAAELPVSFTRLGGVVYLKGRAAGGTAGTAFILPVGYRPAVSGLYGVANGAGTAPSLTRVVVNSNGTVTLVSGSAPNFDGITFPAAP